MVIRSLPIGQEGIVLLSVLWINVLIGGLTIYLLSSNIINSKSAAGYQIRAQQFEAAEAGLLKGEKQLQRRIRQSGSKTGTIILPNSNYAGYHLTFYAVQLPQVFCVMPTQSKGYYYQLTVTARASHSSSTTAPLSLQSIIAIPSNEPCKPSWIKRQAGRSAWCQLTI